jgi:hypothetical protein
LFTVAIFSELQRVDRKVMVWRFCTNFVVQSNGFELLFQVNYFRLHVEQIPCIQLRESLEHAHARIRAHNPGKSWIASGDKSGSGHDTQ